VSAPYVPETGDFVWLTFDPQAGREQAGRRPALVLSPRTYNAKSGLALVVRSRTKSRDIRSKWPFPPLMGQLV
jgi:mRNA interferase MazF